MTTSLPVLAQLGMTTSLTGLTSLDLSGCSLRCAGTLGMLRALAEGTGGSRVGKQQRPAGSSRPPTPRPLPLTDLNLSDNTLSDDVFPSLLALVSSCTLRRLSLAANPGLTERATCKMLIAVWGAHEGGGEDSGEGQGGGVETRVPPSLTHLDLSRNPQLRGMLAQTLGWCLQQRCCALSSCHLSGCALSSPHLVHLLLSSLQHGRMQRLDVSGCLLQPEGAEALGATCTAMLAAAAAAPRSPRTSLALPCHLLLANMDLRDEGFLALAGVLSSLTPPQPLRQLLLQSNRAGPAGVSALCRALASGGGPLGGPCHYTSLQSLDLSGNRLGLAGAEDLAAAVKLLPSLSHLACGKCGLGAGELALVCGALKPRAALLDALSTAVMALTADPRSPTPTGWEVLDGASALPGEPPFRVARLCDELRQLSHCRCPGTPADAACLLVATAAPATSSSWPLLGALWLHPGLQPLLALAVTCTCAGGGQQPSNGGPPLGSPASPSWPPAPALVGFLSELQRVSQLPGSLCSLSFSGNMLDRPGARALGASVALAAGLEALDLAGCELGEVCQDLATGFRRATALACLDPSPANPEIHLCPLAMLDLSCCRLNSSQTAHLAAVLDLSPRLRVLALDHCSMHEMGHATASHLSAALLGCGAHLLQLSLDECCHCAAVMQVGLGW